VRVGAAQEGLLTPCRAGVGRACRRRPAGDAGPKGDPADAPDPKLTVLGTYRSKLLDVGAAEIVSYHLASKRLFVVNAKLGTLDTVDLAVPATPTKVTNPNFAFNAEESPRPEVRSRSSKPACTETAP
jgi:hypothetical protein